MSLLITLMAAAAILLIAAIFVICCLALGRAWYKDKLRYIEIMILLQILPTPISRSIIIMGILGILGIAVVNLLERYISDCSPNN